MLQKSSLMNKFTQIVSNRVIIYLVTRYMTYVIQFISSIIIAVKLGAYYLGIWSFILLLLNYFQLFNLGISNSANILLVQYKSDQRKQKEIIASSITLIGCLSFFIVGITLYYYFCGISLLNKYALGKIFYVICIIAIVAHFNNLFTIIYRVKNRLFEVSIFQSIIPLLSFLFVYFAKEDKLLYLLLLAYILGNIISLLIYLYSGEISFSISFYYKVCMRILKKGIFLFLYNLSFYLILVSLRTVISIYYSIEQFGLFSFSFTLAQTIILFLDTFSFIVFPKLIDRLNSKDTFTILDTFKMLANNYATFAHLLVYSIIVLFQIFSSITNKYENIFSIFSLLSLTTMLTTNSIGYLTYLQAKNKEKTIGIIAFGSLLLNVVFMWLMVRIFNATYTQLVFATMISYLVFNYSCFRVSYNELKIQLSFSSSIQLFFPLKLSIPYISSLVIYFCNMYYLSFIPLLLFVLLNWSEVKGIVITLRKIIITPKIINLDNN